MMAGMRWTPLQAEEVEAGKKNLSPESAAVFTRRNFDFMQMQVLRLALETGQEIAQVKKAAKPWISHEEMKEILEALKRGEDPVIPRRPLPRFWFMLAPAIGLILGTGSCYEPASTLTVPLRQSEIRLSVGMEFAPEKYVDISAVPAGMHLEMPEGFICSTPETRLAAYRLEAEGRQAVSILRILIVDEEPPVLALSCAEVELGEETAFDCMSFVEKAQDNVDGDLRRRVSCSNDLEDLADQTVVYEVKDSSGNTAAAELHVHRISLINTSDISEEEEKETSAAPALVPAISPLPVEASSLSPAQTAETLPEETYVYEEVTEIGSTDVWVEHVPHE